MSIKIWLKKTHAEIRVLREKYHTHIWLIMLDTILVMWLFTQIAQAFEPRTIYIDLADTSTGGYIESSVSSVSESTGDGEPGNSNLSSSGDTVATQADIRVGQDTIRKMICDEFGERCEDALKIAECESQFDPSRIGDKHLTFERNGQTLGSSIGLFQIRTGGQEGGGWSRPAKEGLSADEFIKKMQDPKENIRMAKRIYSESGNNFRQWTCARITNIK